MSFVLNELSEQVIAAAASHKRVLVKGSGSKGFYGNPASGTSESMILLDVAAYKGVIEYEPSELVMTAACGTPLQEIEKLLDEQNQMLPWEPPHFGPGATIGGAIATGLAGPRRMSAGATADFVLGTRMMNAEGGLLRFGGQVMKNVAGYDVSRLLVGSLGIFGPLMEISFKVLPKPLVEKTLRHACTINQALDVFRQVHARSLCISASSWVPEEGKNGHLYLRLSGSEVAVSQAKTQLPGDELADADARAFWLSLREQTHPFFNDATIWRVAVPPLAGKMNEAIPLVEWGGAQRWLRQVQDTRHVRHNAQQLGGHATLFRYPGPDAIPGDGVFHPFRSNIEGITRRLKNALDPRGIFNPDRLIKNL
ncbi:glycolate oxidase subunit GlcE [Advenella sp. WQ 585]|uniref:Glycolate oxidase subunit GlcE n=1 Tax=Advenella mandrilli TaxID=2800330 RepID=A0ABS1EDS4_9BURK|nr:glycolate oxidase subunit GlcE [Advenella mandrilli]MBK1781058.1 glycolate oxidase subunit GlcE [Advenella mandrilli]